MSDEQRIKDEAGMRLALDQAHNALLVGEVQVGAVILRDGQVLATGYNRPITTHDPTAHAEIVALRHAAQRIEQAKLQAGRIFIQIGAPDMPVKLGRTDPPAQQRQPQPGIKLAVEEKALSAIGFCQRDRRLRQGFFPGITGDRQCRVGFADACCITDDHKPTRLLVIGGQLVVKEPQNGLVVVWDIRSQYMYQCCHARLRQSKNTPLQRAK